MPPVPPPKSLKPRTLAVACAECRRLKLKCSRTVPCESCTRRGCETICPDGRLRAGRGTRFILADTQELHDEIDRLHTRVRELEQALAIMQAQTSQEPHPLLGQGFTITTTHRTSTKSKLHEPEPPDESDEDKLIDTFGSLALNPDDGSSRWCGRHGGSEFLIESHSPSQGSPSQASQEDPLPLDLMLVSQMFPFQETHQVNEELRRRVRECLPKLDEAIGLAKQWKLRVCRLGEILHLEELMELAFNPVFHPEEGRPARDDQVALVFSVFAVVVVTDLKRRYDDPLGKRFIHLARTSMMLGEDIFSSRSLLIIYSIHLMAIYYHMSGGFHNNSRAWMLTSLSLRMAQSAGLHRDSDRWDKFPVAAERRRRLWWEMTTFECILCYGMGQPRAVTASQCDVKMPHDAEDDGGPTGFHRTIYKWMQGNLFPVFDEAFAPKPPKYDRLLQLDRNMRNHELPNVAHHFAHVYDPANGGAPDLLLTSFAMDAYKEAALMYLHRTYLVEALTRYPDHPLSCKWGISVYAVHRSALIIMTSFRRFHEQYPNMIPKVQHIWVFSISAYVCLCAIVIRSPGCSLSPSSLLEINNTKKMFDEMNSAMMQIETIFRAKQIVNKLHEQAHAAFKAHQTGLWKPHKPPTRNSADQDEEEVGDNHVLRLAGASMLVAATENELSKAGTKAPPVLNPQSASHVHTTLLDYLQAFQRNEDPGQDLIRDSHSTLSDPPLNGTTFTNVHTTHTPSVVSTNEVYPSLFEPIDVGNGWPLVDVLPFPFDLANPSPPVQTQADAAAAGQVQSDTFLGQDAADLFPLEFSHGTVLGAVEEDSSVFQQFFANQMAALDNNGPDQGWESFLSSYHE